MAEIKNNQVSFDAYIRSIEDQELKGILLKLKNEMRKPDVPWETIKKILQSLMDKDKEVLKEVALLILK
ncbi:MAG TPA: hypothetical protein VNN20_11355 [Thermodesulfobacteriota bacterium]|jgi:hypothetical protein|nr:hypothetical protein [Thermodesulfobacteriota bacterium]